MKATELRIGNLILHDLDVNEVIAISKDDIVIDGFAGKSDSFQPIPITEEWIFKFGFEKVERNQWYSFYKLDDFKVLIHTKDYSSMINWKDCSIEDKFNWTIHELQNLYHALTGEELEIK